MARRTNDQLKAAGHSFRVRGEGTVFEVPGRPGYFRAVRTLEIAGKWVQVSGSGATQEQAIQRRERNVIKKLAPTQQVSSQANIYQQAIQTTKKLTSSSSFHELLLDWLEWRRYQTIPSKKISGAVRKQYETHIRLHLGPSEMGKTPIGELNRAVIETYFFRELPRNTKVINRDGEDVEVPQLSVSNQRAQQSIVNMALNYAVFPLGLLPSNPSIGMERIQKEDAITSNMGLETKRKMAYRLALLLEGHPQEARWMFQLLTGARQSEVLGATWSESFMYLLDDAEPSKPPRFIVQQQLVRDPDDVEKSIDGKRPKRRLKVVKRTKSRSSRRVIPLDPRLVEILLEHKRRQEDERWALRDHPDPEKRWQEIPGFEDLVFSNRGRPISHQTDHKKWKALLKQYEHELEGDQISLHGLRHLAASLLATTPGVSLEHIRNILGHGSVSVTTAVYLHIGAQNLVSPIESYTSVVFRDRDLRREGKPVPPYSDDEYYRDEARRAT